MVESNVRSAVLVEFTQEPLDGELVWVATAHEFDLRAHAATKEDAAAILIEMLEAVNQHRKRLGLKALPMTYYAMGSFEKAETVGPAQIGADPELVAA